MVQAGIVNLQDFGMSEFPIYLPGHQAAADFVTRVEMLRASGMYIPQVFGQGYVFPPELFSHVRPLNPTLVPPRVTERRGLDAFLDRGIAAAVTESSLAAIRDFERRASTSSDSSLASSRSSLHSTSSSSIDTIVDRALTMESDRNLRRTISGDLVQNKIRQRSSSLNGPDKITALRKLEKTRSETALSDGNLPPLPPVIFSGVGDLIAGTGVGTMQGLIDITSKSIENYYKRANVKEANNFNLKVEKIEKKIQRIIDEPTLTLFEKKINVAKEVEFSIAVTKLETGIINFDQFNKYLDHIYKIEAKSLKLKPERQFSTESTLPSPFGKRAENWFVRPKKLVSDKFINRVNKVTKGNIPEHFKKILIENEIDVFRLDKDYYRSTTDIGFNRFYESVYNRDPRSKRLPPNRVGLFAEQFNHQFKYPEKIPIRILYSDMYNVPMDFLTSQEMEGLKILEKHLPWVQTKAGSPEVFLLKQINRMAEREVTDFTQFENFVKDYKSKITIENFPVRQAIIVDMVSKNLETFMDDYKINEQKIDMIDFVARKYMLNPIKDEHKVKAVLKDQLQQRLDAYFGRPDFGATEGLDEAKTYMYAKYSKAIDNMEGIPQLISQSTKYDSKFRKFTRSLKLKFVKNNNVKKLMYKPRLYDTEQRLHNKKEAKRIDKILRAKNVQKLSSGGFSMFHIANSLMAVNHMTNARIDKFLSGYYANMAKEQVFLEITQELADSIGQLGLDVSLMTQNKWAFMTSVITSSVIKPLLQAFEVVFHAQIKQPFTEKESILSKYKTFVASEYTGNRICLNPVSDTTVFLPYREQIDKLMDNTTIWTDSLGTKIMYYKNGMIEYRSKVFVSCFMGHLKLVNGDGTRFIRTLYSDSVNMVNTFEITNLNDLFNTIPNPQFTCGKEVTLEFIPKRYRGEFSLIETTIDRVSSLTNDVCNYQPWRDLLVNIDSCEFDPTSKIMTKVSCQNLMQYAEVSPETNKLSIWSPFDTTRFGLTNRLYYYFLGVNKYEYNLNLDKDFYSICNLRNYDNYTCFVNLDFDLINRQAAKLEKLVEVKISLLTEAEYIAFKCDNIPRGFFGEKISDSYKIVSTRYLAGSYQCGENLYLTFNRNPVKKRYQPKLDNVAITRRPMLIDETKVMLDITQKTAVTQDVLDLLMAPRLTYKDLYAHVYAVYGNNNYIIYSGKWTAVRYQYEKTPAGPLLTFKGTDGCLLTFNLASNEINLKCKFIDRMLSEYDGNLLMTEISTSKEFCNNSEIIYMRHLEWCQQTPLNPIEAIDVEPKKFRSFTVFDIVKRSVILNTKPKLDMVSEDSMKKFIHYKNEMESIADFIDRYFETLKFIKNETEVAVKFDKEKFEEFDKFINKTLYDKVNELYSEFVTKTKSDFKINPVDLNSIVEVCFEYSAGNWTLLNKEETFKKISQVIKVSNNTEIDLIRRFLKSSYRDDDNPGIYTQAVILINGTYIDVKEVYDKTWVTCQFIEMDLLSPKTYLEKVVILDFEETLENELQNEFEMKYLLRV
ncbi:poxvirus B22R superfamily protein [Carp edema virus]|nr:poxvirus B22R superfamily protein [Carp edema virus]